MARTLTVDEAKSVPLEDLLREVAVQREPVRIVLGGDAEVEISPVVRAKPLLTFDGYVPDGWKDAIYEPR